ncbi:MAG: sigma-70 family RNA polymerase sigma factor [Planctomycetota bacterium]
MDLHACLARAPHDLAARDRLVARFYPTVQQMVHRRLDAERRKGKLGLAALFSTGDLVHDVFMRVLHGVEVFEGDEQDFERYLAKAVTHRLLDAIRYHEAARRDGRRAAPDDTSVEPASDETSPTEAATIKEEAEIVTEAMGALTVKDRRLLELRLRQRTTYRQIAEELGLPSEDAARKAICLAEARLLLALRARGVDA